MRILLPAAILSLLVAGAGQGDDYEQAFRLRESGEILPLEELMRRLDLGPDARILEIESELEHGRRVYEIEYLTNDGDIYELEVDAATGRILKQERE